MSAPSDFLSPRFDAGTVDVYAIRTAIVTALRDELPHFHGTVLDVGAGRSPYKPLLLAPPSRATRYIALDLPGNPYAEPEITWDGKTLPFDADSIDCALATEVLEHCPDPSRVLAEIARVLKPGGFVFVTVPFLWPLHDVPHDEYRYTPFALERLAHVAGFASLRLRALGGWDASLAQLLGLWARRRPMPRPLRAVVSRAVVPFVRALQRLDRPPREFGESTMLTGLAGVATKGAA